MKNLKKLFFFYLYTLATKKLLCEKLDYILLATKNLVYQNFSLYTAGYKKKLSIKKGNRT